MRAKLSGIVFICIDERQKPVSAARNPMKSRRDRPAAGFPESIFAPIAANARSVKSGKPFLRRFGGAFFFIFEAPGGIISHIKVFVFILQEGAR